jgi:hypothetical protein
MLFFGEKSFFVAFRALVSPPRQLESRSPADFGLCLGE